jgi:hypothetical protein
VLLAEVCFGVFNIMAHAYSASLDVDASSEALFRYLAKPAMQNVYLRDSKVAFVPDTDVGVGSRWMEARKSLLFLRDWAQVSEIGQAVHVNAIEVVLEGTPVSSSTGECAFCMSNSSQAPARSACTEAA